MAVPVRLAEEMRTLGIEVRHLKESLTESRAQGRPNPSAKKKKKKASAESSDSGLSDCVLQS